MVDLVKIRKKAKEKAEGRRQKAEVPAPGGAPRLSPVEVPAAETAAAPRTIAPPATSKLQRFLETAGQRKSVEAAKVIATVDQLEVLTFFIAGELYAIDIENVVEIITPRPITRIPNAEPAVVGILSLRGTVVTLLDVRRRLGHPGEPPSNDEVRVVVVQHNGEHLGFAVDRVLRVVRADAASLEPHPVVHASEQDESVRGVFRLGDALTILLDFDKLLSRN
ncbi:MAG TPA: chemotaxis protein CheW [Thermoanaerobaculia bacterium]|nr:chemotaxis protein CheW [Thermoanaerobaculia bacterium]